MNLLGFNDRCAVNFPPLASVPDLRQYQIIAVAVSGGKDSHQALYQTELVVAAWGSDGARHDRADELLARLAPTTVHALALTANGQPSHPLRLAADLHPQPLAELVARRAA